MYTKDHNIDAQKCLKTAILVFCIPNKALCLSVSSSDNFLRVTPLFLYKNNFRPPHFSKHSLKLKIHTIICKNYNMVYNGKRFLHNQNKKVYKRPDESYSEILESKTKKDVYIS